MKLLFDENLPPRLIEVLADVYPESSHVQECGLGASKDSDFQERSVLLGSPPKVIWLRTNNCASVHIEFLLQNASNVVARFLDQQEETCLILGERGKKKN